MKTTLLSLKAFFTICLLCLVGGVNVMAQDTETVDFTKQGYTDRKAVPEKYNGTDFQITFSKGSGATPPTFYKNASDGDAIRLYKSNTISISSSTKKIKEISFTYVEGGSEDIGYESTSGSYSKESKKWTSTKPEEGVSSVTLTLPTIKTFKHYRLQKVTVTFVGGTTSETETPAPTITPASKTFSKSFKATISCTDAAAKIYYTLNGNTPDANSTPYTTGITIPEETTTLKAVAIKDGKASKVADAVYTYVAVTPEKPNAPNIYTIWSEDWSKYKKDDKPTEGSNATYECKNGGSITKIYNEEVAGGTAPELLISKLEGALTINILDLKNFFGTLYFSLTSNADKINLSSATENITLGKFTKEGEKYTCAITIPQGTKGLNLKIENKIKKNIRVDDLSLFAKIGSFTITPAQYGTYYTEDAFVMPEGVTGYTITEKNRESLTLNADYPANEVVPAKTALLLKATEKPATNQEFTYTIVNSTAAAPADNLLHGSVEATETQVEGATAYYKLAQGEEGLGFYWANENGTAFTNGANKAYLAVKGNLSQMRGFSFESMTTGINNVVANTNNSKNAVIYDLNGRRVNSLNAAKGVYIVNGKKVIVK
mgnify:CR=1 FL=1